MDKSFSIFLNTYLDAWRNSSLVDLKELISPCYEAREITGGSIDDFGYDESLNGWEQGFNFAKESNAGWDIRVISILPLREDETMAILSATLVIQGERLKTANLFFQTFRKYNQGDWKLVRSYIEAGISLENANDMFFSNQVL